MCVKADVKHVSLVLRMGPICRRLTVCTDALTLELLALYFMFPAATRSTQ